MTRHFIAAVAVLFAGTGLSYAQCCPATDCCVPTSLQCPVTVYHKPAPCPAKTAPPQCLPGPLVYARELGPPTCGEAPPSPPIQLFPCPPRPVELFTLSPPPVTLFRKEAAPPNWKEVPPAPPITVFCKEIGPVKCGPRIVFPSIKVYSQPQPACPVDCSVKCSIRTPCAACAK